MYGRQPRDIDGEDLVTIETSIDEEELLLSRIDDLVELNKRFIPQARTNILKYKVKMIDRYNKSAKTVKYYVNDLVMVLNRSVLDMSSALVSRWIGPYRISEVLGRDVYKVRDEQLELPSPYHADQLKLYKSRPRLAVNLKYYSKKQDLA